MPQIPTISDKDIELTDADIEGSIPQIGEVPDLNELHAANLASERSAYDKALRLGRIGSTAAIGTRVAGSLFSNVPIIGALAGGGSEILARGLEYASGSREAPSLGAAVSESAGPVLANAAIGAIPGGRIAQSIRQGGRALKYSAPTASRYLAGRVVPGALEGAAIGAGSTAASSLAQGELPSPQNIATGGAFGGIIGGVAGRLGERPHEAFAMAPHKGEIKKTDLALARITKSLNVPRPEAEKFIKRLRTAMSEVYAYKGPGEWNSVEHLGQAATDTADEYLKNNYDVISNAFKHARVTGNQIASNVLLLSQNTLPGKAGDAFRKEVLATVRAYRNKTFSIEQLESFRKTLNDELNSAQKLSGKSMADTIAASPSLSIKKFLLDGIRGTINKGLDNFASLQEGETAGTLKTYAAIKDLAERATQRGSEVNLENMVRKGTPWSIEQGVDATLRAVGLRQANPAAAAGSTAFSMAGRSRSHPDNLVKSAKRLLDETALDPTKGGGPHRVLATPLSPRYRPYTGQVMPPGGGGGGNPPTGIGPGSIPGQVVPPSIQIGSPPNPRLLTSGSALTRQEAPPNPYLGPERRRSILTPQEAAEQQAIRLSERFIERRRNQEVGDWLEHNMGLPEAGRWVRGYKPSSKYSKD